MFGQERFGRSITLPAGFFGICMESYGAIRCVNLTPRRYAFVSPLGQGRLSNNLHIYDLHTSSYKMIFFTQYLRVDTNITYN